MLPLGMFVGSGGSFGLPLRPRFGAKENDSVMLLEGVLFVSPRGWKVVFICELLTAFARVMS